MAKGDLSKFWEFATNVTASRQATFMKAVIAQHEVTLKVNKSKSVARTASLHSCLVHSMSNP
jgi:hypothetical protein